MTKVQLSLVALYVLALMPSTPSGLEAREVAGEVSSQAQIAQAMLASAEKEPEPGLLERRAGVALKRVSLAEAISQLSVSSGIHFVFSPSQLDQGAKIVGCACRDLSVGEALDSLLADTPFSYVTMEERILIVPSEVDIASNLASRDYRRNGEGGAPRSTLMVPRPAVIAPGPLGLIAQEGSIRGSVRAGETGAPLSGVVVRLRELERSALTDGEGAYLLANVPPGVHTVVASMLGRGLGSQVVTVEANAVATADFSLWISPIALEAMVVTATGERRRAEVANTVSSIPAEEIAARGAVTNMSDLLTARAPGVQVLGSTQTVGSHSRIRIRGISSVSLSNDPIVFLDGVRVASTLRAGAVERLSFGPGMDVSSRFDDINPDEVESIEVLKGPAAVALYGTDAANGVIVIRTKRGEAGHPSWRVFSEFGLTERPSGFPDAFYSAGQRADNGNDVQCLVTELAAGTCTQTEIRTLNLLEDEQARPFKTGLASNIGLQLSGGSDEIRYFFSGKFSDEVGSLSMPRQDELRIKEERGVGIPEEQRRPNALRTIHLRGNLSTQVSSNVQLDVTAGHIVRNQRNPWVSGGASIISVMRNALGGPGFKNANDGWLLFSPGDLMSVESSDDLQRSTGGVTLRWIPTEWLETRLEGGLDVMTSEITQLQRRGQGPVFFGLEDGWKQLTFRDGADYTATALAIGRFAPAPRVALTSTMGAQYFRSRFRQVFGRADILVPGSEVLAGGAIQGTGEQVQETATIGALLEQTVGYDDRLFVTGSVRTDQSSAFGTKLDAVLYPRASVSWVISRETFFPQTGFLGDTRFRMAYGQSGVNPGTLDALGFYSPVQVITGDGSAVGLQLDALGNDDLKPERISEFETGVDVDLFEGRVAFQFTYYRKTSQDALINRPLPLSLGLGTPSRFENLGSVRNQGWEAQVDLNAYQHPRFSWDLTLAGSRNTNELLDLGEGVAPIIETYSNSRGAEGYPLWGRWARPILGFEDTNGNGIIEPNEVQVGDEEVFLGPSLPTKQGSIQSTMGFGGGSVQLGLRVDYQGGHLAYNRTERDRCSSAGNCRAVNDPSASLWSQARAVAARESSLGRTPAGYFEDGAFTRLREVSLTVPIPIQLLSRLGAQEGTFSIVGSNLFTWTSYSGVDPEGAWLDTMALDMNRIPVSRRWTFRSNIAF